MSIINFQKLFLILESLDIRIHFKENLGKDQCRQDTCLTQLLWWV